MAVKVSIIVCVYKVEQFIHECMKHLINQTYKNIEIILVDDGSPDNCPWICDDYAIKDNRIKVVHQENKGHAGARNTGIHAATGRYIGFADPDDWIETTMVAGMVKTIEAEKADIVVCDWTDYLHEKKAFGEVHSLNIDNNLGVELIRDEFLFDHYPNFLWNKLFARELFDGITIPEDASIEDLFVCAELFARARKIYYLPEKYCYYRMHYSTANALGKIKRKYGLYRAWREHERVCNDHKLRPLAYSRKRAVEAAISLLSLDAANHYLTDEQKKSVQDYLSKVDITFVEIDLRHTLQWKIIKTCPAILRVFGAVSLYADKLKRALKY